MKVHVKSQLVHYNQGSHGQEKVREFLFCSVNCQRKIRISLDGSFVEVKLQSFKNHSSKRG